MSLKRKFKFEDVEEGKSLHDYKAFGESIFLSFFFSVLGLHVTSVMFSNLPLLQTFSLFSCLEMRNNLLSDCFCVCLCTRTLMLLGQVKVPQDQYRRTQPDTRFVEE